MRYLSLLEVLELHEMIISSSGGSYGVRDIRTLESAINQPRITFNQTDLYPDIISKASAYYRISIKRTGRGKRGNREDAWAGKVGCPLYPARFSLLCRGGRG